MTPPRDPRDFDDDMLIRQLRRRLRSDDVRGRDLLFEAQLRLWSRRFQLEDNAAATKRLTDETGKVADLVEDLAAELGVPKPRPRLEIVRGGDDG